MRYRIHFEPIDVDGNVTPDQIPDYITNNVHQIHIRKIIPIDKDGFPVEMS